MGDHDRVCAGDTRSLAPTPWKGWEKNCMLGL